MTRSSNNRVLRRYRAAVRANPDYYQAQHNLGHLLDDLGRAEEAEAAYRQALRVRPDLALTHILLGFLLRHAIPAAP